MRYLKRAAATLVAMAAVTTSLTVTPVAVAASTAIRIDAGSSAAYTDAAGQVWAADTYFTGGTTTANATRTGPSLTSDPQLIKTMRYGTDFTYAIPVTAAGTYLVRLHTSELNFATAGSRKFTITTEGRSVATDLDLAKAPGQRNPWTLEVPVAVNDSKLDLRFTAALDYAQISAIEVISGGVALVPSAVVGPTDTTVRVDAGSAAAYTDAAGQVWAADTYFTGGTTTANATRTGPSMTSDPQLIKTMRYGTDFTYAIPVTAAGTYLVRLHTSELNFAIAGSRKFTITTEGRSVATDLDLAKAPGQRNPWTLEVPVAVNDSKLDLRFTAALDYAQISAIEVIRRGAPDPYKLVWADEFNGTTVDSTRWNVRNDKYQDNELSINTARSQNVFTANGALTIRSLRENRTVGSITRNYTSGYLDTIHKQSWTYGRFEIRAKLSTQKDTSKGIWPAFWMRPNDGGFGEIDIMEAIGSGNGGTESNKTHQTIHHDYNGGQPAQSVTTASPAGHPSDGFHIYSVLWEAGTLTWFIDGKQVWRRDRTTTAWFDEAFAKPFNIRLNQQIGGSWAGTPDSATKFPSDYVVDWVRVYQKP